MLVSVVAFESSPFASRPSHEQTETATATQVIVDRNLQTERITTAPSVSAAGYATMSFTTCP